MGYYSEDRSKVVGVIIGKRIAKAPRTRANHFLVVKVGDTKRNFFVSQSNFNILEKGDSLWLRKSECIIKDVSSALFTNSLIDIRQ